MGATARLEPEVAWEKWFPKKTCLSAGSMQSIVWKLASKEAAAHRTKTGSEQFAPLLCFSALLYGNTFSTFVSPLTHTEMKPSYKYV